MLTKNRNLLPLTGFKIKFGAQIFKNLEFFATSVGLPSISLSEGNTAYRKGLVYTPAERIVYDSLTVQFALDENLEVYNEIHNWMKRQLDEVEYYDMALSFLTSHNNVSRQVSFKSAFPISCSGINLNVTSGDVEYGSIDVSFRYDTFEFTS
jgi:hypothetical protein